MSSQAHRAKKTVRDTVLRFMRGESPESLLLLWRGFLLVYLVVAPFVLIALFAELAPDSAHAVSMPPTRRVTDFLARLPTSSPFYTFVGALVVVWLIWYVLRLTRILVEFKTKEGSREKHELSDHDWWVVKDIRERALALRMQASFIFGAVLVLLLAGIYTVLFILPEIFDYKGRASGAHSIHDALSSEPDYDVYDQYRLRPRLEVSSGIAGLVVSECWLRTKGLYTCNPYHLSSLSLGSGYVEAMTGAGFYVLKSRLESDERIAYPVYRIQQIVNPPESFLSDDDVRDDDLLHGSVEVVGFQLNEDGTSNENGIEQRHDGAGISNQVTADKSFFSDLSVMRIATLLILFFLVQILARLSQYCLRLAAFWDSRADALLLAKSFADGGSKGLGRLMSAMSPDLYDFKPQPRSPLYGFLPRRKV